MTVNMGVSFSGYPFVCVILKANQEEHHHFAAGIGEAGSRVVLTGTRHMELDGLPTLPKTEIIIFLAQC